ncbi:hypothetical protein PFISCL1PPCAC_13014, partial [Pristionchus fissidentatus]
YTAQLVFEMMAGLLVALSNAVVIIVFMCGWGRLVKEQIYVVVANLIVFTSMKGLVELGFTIPYYILRRQQSESPEFGYYPTQYALILFNMSVLADYVIMLFSVLIAANRCIAVARSFPDRQTYFSALSSFRENAQNCYSSLIWLCAISIPLLSFSYCIR